MSGFHGIIQIGYFKTNEAVMKLAILSSAKQARDLDFYFIKFTFKAILFYLKFTAKD